MTVSATHGSLIRRLVADLGGRAVAAGRDALFYLTLLLFAAACLAWSLAGAGLHRLLPASTGEALGRRLVTALTRCFLGFMRITGQGVWDLTALDALRSQGAVVIVANHPSLLDAVLVMSRLPNLICITKGELWDNLLFGGGMRASGYIRNDAPLALVKRAVGRLTGRDQLLIFPEGTRGPRGTVGAFKGGFAVMAKRARVPVQTVLIDTDSAFLGKGAPLFRRPALPLVYRARLGRRFEVTGNAQEFVAALERYFREELARPGATQPGPG